MSSDPAAGTANPRTPIDRMRWLYGGNDPLEVSDPTGLLAVIAAGGGGCDPKNAACKASEASDVQYIKRLQTQKKHASRTKQCCDIVGAIKTLVVDAISVQLQDQTDFAIGFGGAVLGTIELTPPVGFVIEGSHWLDPNSPERQEVGLFLNNGHPSWDSYETAANYAAGVEQNTIVSTVKNWEAHPLQLAGELTFAALTLKVAGGITSDTEAAAGGAGANAAATSGPKLSPNFKPPTNAPQLPPTVIPSGWRVRLMPPAPGYPNGYWRLEKPMSQGGWQAIDPSTGKPGTQPETHVPFPPGGRV